MKLSLVPDKRRKVGQRIAGLILDNKDCTYFRELLVYFLDHPSDQQNPESVEFAKMRLSELNTILDDIRTTSTGIRW